VNKLIDGGSRQQSGLTHFMNASHYQPISFLENELVTRIENKLRVKHRANVKADK